MQIVVTGRDYVSEPWLEWLVRFRLSGFGPEQVKELAEKWLGKGQQLERFLTQLDEMEALKGVMQIPLLATLTLLVFRQTKNLPGSRTKLYGSIRVSQR